MGLSILDANDYVPSPNEDQSIPLPPGGMGATGTMPPWMGMGPQLAAAGNMGGLQQALLNSRAGGAPGGASVPTAMQQPQGGAPMQPQGQPQQGGLGGLGNANPLVNRMLPTRPFSQDEAQQVGALMQGRLRSNEDIANAVQERKGALEQLVAANSKPSNPLSWAENYMMGTADAPFWATGGMASETGIQTANKAYKDKLAQQQAQGVQNAELRLQTMQGEEKYASEREKDALNNMGKILSAQQRSSLANQLGIIHTADGVMQIGPDGVPHMIMPATKDYKTLVTKATQAANNAVSGYQFNSLEERQAAFNKEFQNAMNMQSGAVTSLIQNQMNQGSLPQATPSAGGMDPGTRLGDGLTSQTGSSNTNFSPAGKLQKALQDAGGNPMHAAISMWETNNKNAVNPNSGAAGPMQVMPQTMTNPGFGIQPARDKSPEELRRVGNQYYDALVNKYGNEPMALVAYNWGPGNADKWLQAGGDPRRLPQETREYVSGVLLNKQLLAGMQPQTAGAAPAQGQPTQNQSGATQPGNTQATPATAPTQPQQQDNGAAARYPTAGVLQDADKWIDKYSVNNQQPTVIPPGGAPNAIVKLNAKNVQDIQSNNNKILETATKVAQASRSEDETATDVRQLLHTGYNPGAGAAVRDKFGKILQMFGVPDTNRYVNQAASGEMIAGILNKGVNDRMQHEAGQQTDADHVRIFSQFPQLTDMNAPFNFKLDVLQELAQRNQLRETYLANLKKKNGTADFQASWNNFADKVLGPSVLTVGGQPITRGQFIEQGIQGVLAKHPGVKADVEDLKQQGAQRWLELARQQAGTRYAE